MSDKVWMSSVLSNYDIGMKQGLRAKFYGHDWNPATLEIPLSPDQAHAASKRHREGYALARSEFPEAAAVWDEKRFKKVKDIFTAASGPFYAVRGKLAEVLARFDLGEGGLISFPIYKADLETPYPGEFFLLNFGCRKNTVLPEQSRNIAKIGTDHKTGIEWLRVHHRSEDGDIALSKAAMDGPDLWFEERVDNKIFMSDSLAKAIIEIGMGDVFIWQECRVLEGAQ
jgi:hypothetical protein